jgi:hypothetical protein
VVTAADVVPEATLSPPPCTDDSETDRGQIDSSAQLVSRTVDLAAVSTRATSVTDQGMVA